jgi:hypothetical protein
MTFQDQMVVENQIKHHLSPILKGSTSRILKVKGMCVGKVVKMTCAIKPFNQDQDPMPKRPPWISSTKNLHIKIPELRSGSHKDLNRRDDIWKTLTMSLLDRNTMAAGTSCFSMLWCPEGRGAIQNLGLIDWIDRNAWFQFVKWTLREWSQVQAPWYSIANLPNWKGRITGVVNEAPTEQHTNQQRVHTTQDLDSFIQVLDKVLRSGQRLACIRSFAWNNYPCMVPSNAKISDVVYYLWGCRYPVLLREVDGAGEGQRF